MLPHCVIWPIHTFYGGGGRNTTVDFCLVDCWAAHLVLECGILPRHPLNLSDHLALKLKLDCQLQEMSKHEDNGKLNWQKANSKGCIKSYQELVTSNVGPLFERPLVSITEVDEEIAAVVTVLYNAAMATIPSCRRKSQIKNFIRDEELKQKCHESKLAWKTRRNANRPRPGPLYEQMKTAKSEVKLCVIRLRAKQERMTLQARDNMFRFKDEWCFNLHGKGWNARSWW